jgi:PQQ-dependent dehydrogenase (methanol/ethanol family)
MKRTLFLALLIPLLVMTASAQSPLAAYSPVTEAMLLDPPAEDWLMWRRTQNHWAHSDLDQIDRDTVSNLGLSWAWTLDPAANEVTPLVHDGVMFLVQGNDFVQALDARDGTLLWQYRREVVDHAAGLAAVNRNGALFEDKLYIATHDAFLVALDVATGQVVWEQPVGDWTIGHHYSGGPQIINGNVVAGMSGCYYINTGCWISAHDSDSGEELWRTNTIPGPGEPGGDTWGDVPPESRRGGSAWIAPSYDPDLNLIYYGIAVPIPWGSVQRGTGDADVLYTNSTLALDGDTGEIAWYFQHIPNEEWDLDHPFERLIVETAVSPDPDSVEWLNEDIVPGETRKVITGIPGKTGIIWTLDAATGDFLWARSTNYQNVVVDVDVEGRHGVSNPDLRQPDVGEELFVCPHLLGGINWQAVAYSPKTNALYTPTNNTCMTYTLNPVQPTVGAHHGSARSTRVHVPDSDELVGLLTAVSVETGETLWQVRQRAGFHGSVLSTGGDLVFVTDDARRFRAFDAETGDVLWETILNSTAGGYPVTYMVDGEQYVAIGAGGAGSASPRSITPEYQQNPGGNMLFVFKLR